MLNIMSMCSPIFVPQYISLRYTHSCSTTASEEGQQVPSFHQLHDDELRVIVKTHPQEAEDVGVAEVAHQECLLQELLLLMLRCRLAQSLQYWNESVR